MFLAGLIQVDVTGNVYIKKFDYLQLHFADSKDIDIADPKDGSFQVVEVIDNRWIHLCGAAYSKKFDLKFEFFKRIAKFTDEGATLNSLVLRK